MVVQVPRDVGFTAMLTAPEWGTGVGLEALEHPEAAEVIAKTIIVQKMDNRRDIY